MAVVKFGDVAEFGQKPCDRAQSGAFKIFQRGFQRHTVTLAYNPHEWVITPNNLRFPETG
jgi:hypothetical protein